MVEPMKFLFIHPYHQHELLYSTILNSKIETKLCHDIANNNKDKVKEIDFAHGHEPCMQNTTKYKKFYFFRAYKAINISSNELFTRITC